MKNDLLAALVVVAAALGSVGVSRGADEAKADYLRDIKPLLKERCFACHGALKQQSGLRLDTVALMNTGGDSGAAVVPGQPDESPLLERIGAKDDSLRMPPEGSPLKADEVALIRRWIAEGAPSPKEEVPEKDPRSHWAFQKPVCPAVPAMTAADAVTAPGGNEIDAFLLARLREHGIAPRPLADKATQLRRVTLDLIGVPPTRDELQAFVADSSPDAYEKVVDRLLSDPRYGERWGRHWMDIWRYSDWYGRRHVPDVWNSAPQIWRWRDWIVQSLNSDKGYDRMLQEMLAADEICPEDAEAGVATGYLIRNWYALNPNDWMRNTVEHTGKAFLGLTFNCAHCHDHKYDPITHDDYFRLRAYFETIGVRQDRYPGEADPGPYQEYDYGKRRNIQRLGAVRIFDKNPQAPTWFYTGGDERNRVADRGSMAPGTPEFLSAKALDAAAVVATIGLPPKAWYPGLRPAIQETERAERQQTLAAAESALAALKSNHTEPDPELLARLAATEAAYAAAVAKAGDAKTNGALSGSQSLKMDATTGRRILQNPVTPLKSLSDGTTFEVELKLLTDTHFNVQLAKNLAEGLTAGYVAFEKGRILSYQPGTFTPVEVGRYKFEGGQNRFQVTQIIEASADRCLLSVRSLSDRQTLVDRAPVALNSWNPAVHAGQGIYLDAHAGSVVLLDNIRFAEPKPDANAGAGKSIASFEFEPPAYTDGRDVAGVEGWAASPLGVAPATSMATTLEVVSEEAQAAARQRDAARHAVERPQRKRRAAESAVTAARKELESLETRIAADRARYEETSGVDAAPLIAKASLAQRQAALLRAESDRAAQELALVEAEERPAADMERTKAIEAAKKSLAAAGSALTKAKTALDDPALAATYAPLSGVYPQQSTGRRRALALWITHRDQPLTARVAVNHIWMRHFHSPLVASVSDFGRNGAAPTHPELLDWLAVELMDGPSADRSAGANASATNAGSPWRMKHLHRLIVTSAAYRRSSTTSEIAAAKDPENRWLWRMNAGRMEAEVLRDSLLSVSRLLESKMGGQELENSDALTTFRRSIYYSIFPELGGQNALGTLFDAPNALDCYRRTRTIVPQQALALTNSDLVHRVASEIIVKDQIASIEPQGKTDSPPQPNGETPPSRDIEDAAFVVRMFERILSRRPSVAEQAICFEALRPTESTPNAAAAPESIRKSRESLVRALLNHNDFVTIR